MALVAFTGSAVLAPQPAVRHDVSRPATLPHRAPARAASQPRRVVPHRAAAAATLPRAAVSASAPARPPAVATAAEAARPPTAPGAVTQVCSTGDFLAAMAAAAERDQPAFVLFHAGYCRACIAVVPKFAALARAFGSVSFATVKLEDAGELASRLGVRETPLIHIYDRGNGKVDEFPCGLSSVQRLRDTVQEFAKHSDGFIEEEKEGEHTGTRNL
jgi:thiol-disulfide isomerase/thioredoxin